MDTNTFTAIAQQLIPLTQWEQHFDDLTQRLRKHFARKETKQQAADYLKGLLSPLQRKNGWQLAEQLGHQNPYRIQHLLDRAVCDEEGLRKELCHYVRQHLAAPGAVGGMDESGFLKKGEHSVGVQRQYSGTAGRVENCQIGVFLTYATVKGHTFLDAELYLPKQWTEDASRCEKVKVPQTTPFATKPQLAQAMLERAFQEGVILHWVTADSVYGNDPALCQWLQNLQQPYVMGIKSDLRLCWEGGQIRAQTLGERIPTSDWQVLSAGEGSKGERLFEWAYLALEAPAQSGFGLGLLVRRSLCDATEVAYYRVFSPQNPPLSTLARVAGTRWTVEVSLESAKGEVGLDEYEVRSWHGWYRHMYLCLFAHAFLSVLRSQSLPSSVPDIAKPPLLEVPAEVSEVPAEVSVEKQGDTDTVQMSLKGGRLLPRQSLRLFKQSRGLCCP